MFPLNRKVHMNSRQANLAQIPRDHYVSLLQVPPFKVAPPIRPCLHIYSSVEKGIVRVKCLVQEHITM